MLRCPYCFNETTGVAVIGQCPCPLHSPPPMPGDPICCTYCLKVSILTDEGDTRKPGRFEQMFTQVGPLQTAVAHVLRGMDISRN